MEVMKYSRLSRYKIRKIILCFADDITASSASKILQINRNAISAYYNEIRRKNTAFIEEAGKRFGGIRIGRKLFCSVPGSQKKRAWSSGQNAGFGLLKRNGKVFVTVVSNCSKEEVNHHN